MGSRLRKKVSLGGVIILNISKGRFLMPGGIKGLRVGVNAPTAYKAESSIFSTQFSKNKTNVLKIANTTKEVPTDQISGKNTITALFMISVPIVIVIKIFTSLPLLIFSGYLIAAGFTSMIIFARKARKNRKIIQAFSSALTNEPFSKAEELLLKINEMDRTVRQRILMSNYSTLIDRVFNDQQISEEEELFIKKYSEHLPENFISEANDIIISEIIKAAIEDNFLSEEEDNLINRCFSTFKLPSSRREEFNDTIREYKELEEYRKNKFEQKPITLTSLPKIPFCLYESLSEYLKERIRNGITELIYDDSGAVVLTESSLEIVRTGHKSIKFDSIISANKSWRSDIIEIITINNKTPFYFKVSDPMIFIAIISKMMAK